MSAIAVPAMATAAVRSQPRLASGYGGLRAAAPRGPIDQAEQASHAMLDRTLALAVIYLAIADLTAGPARRGSSRGVTEAERQDAHRFLFAERGPWHTARQAWCLAAGIAPEWLDRHLAQASCRRPLAPARAVAPEGRTGPAAAAPSPTFQSA
jgi:hypothetical protein